MCRVHGDDGAIEQVSRRWRGVDAAIQDERAANLISTQGVAIA